MDAITEKYRAEVQRAWPKYCACGCVAVLCRMFDWRKEDPKGKRLELFKRHNPTHNPIGWHPNIGWS